MPRRNDEATIKKPEEVEVPWHQKLLMQTAQEAYERGKKVGAINELTHLLHDMKGKSAAEIGYAIEKRLEELNTQGV